MEGREKEQQQIDPRTKRRQLRGLEDKEGGQIDPTEEEEKKIQTRRYRKVFYGVHDLNLIFPKFYTNFLTEIAKRLEKLPKSYQFGFKQELISNLILDLFQKPTDNREFLVFCAQSSASDFLLEEKKVGVSKFRSNTNRYFNFSQLEKLKNLEMQLDNLCAGIRKALLEQIALNPAETLSSERVTALTRAEEDELLDDACILHQSIRDAYKNTINSCYKYFCSGGFYRFEEEEFVKLKNKGQKIQLNREEQEKYNHFTYVKELNGLKGGEFWPVPISVTKENKGEKENKKSISSDISSGEFSRRELFVWCLSPAMEFDPISLTKDTEGKGKEKFVENFPYETFFSFYWRINLLNQGLKNIEALIKNKSMFTSARNLTELQDLLCKQWWDTYERFRGYFHQYLIKVQEVREKLVFPEESPHLRECLFSLFEQYRDLISQKNLKEKLIKNQLKEKTQTVNIENFPLQEYFNIFRPKSIVDIAPFYVVRKLEACMQSELPVNLSFTKVINKILEVIREEKSSLLYSEQQTFEERCEKFLQEHEKQKIERNKFRQEILPDYWRKAVFLNRGNRTLISAETEQSLKNFNKEALLAEEFINKIKHYLDENQRSIEGIRRDFIQYKDNEGLIKEHETQLHNWLLSIEENSFLKRYLLTKGSQVQQAIAKARISDDSSKETASFIKDLSELKEEISEEMTKVQKKFGNLREQFLSLKRKLHQKEEIEKQKKELEEKRRNLNETLPIKREDEEGSSSSSSKNDQVQIIASIKDDDKGKDKDENENENNLLLSRLRKETDASKRDYLLQINNPYLEAVAEERKSFELLLEIIRKIPLGFLEKTDEKQEKEKIISLKETCTYFERLKGENVYISENSEEKVTYLQSLTRGITLISNNLLSEEYWKNYVEKVREISFEKTQENYEFIQKFLERISSQSKNFFEKTQRYFSEDSANFSIKRQKLQKDLQDKIKGFLVEEKKEREKEEEEEGKEEKGKKEKPDLLKKLTEFFKTFTSNTPDVDSIAWLQKANDALKNNQLLPSLTVLGATFKDSAQDQKHLKTFLLGRLQRLIEIKLLVAKIEQVKQKEKLSRRNNPSGIENAIKNAQMVKVAIEDIREVEKIKDELKADENKLSESLLLVKKFFPEETQTISSRLTLVIPSSSWWGGAPKSIPQQIDALKTTKILSVERYKAIEELEKSFNNNEKNIFKIIGETSKSLNTILSVVEELKKANENTQKRHKTLFNYAKAFFASVRRREKIYHIPSVEKNVTFFSVFDQEGEPFISYSLLTGIREVIVEYFGSITPRMISEYGEILEDLDKNVRGQKELIALIEDEQKNIIENCSNFADLNEFSPKESGENEEFFVKNFNMQKLEEKIKAMLTELENKELPELLIRLEKIVQEIEILEKLKSYFRRAFIKFDVHSLREKHILMHSDIKEMSKLKIRKKEKEPKSNTELSTKSLSTSDLSELERKVGDLSETGQKQLLGKMFNEIITERLNKAEHLIKTFQNFIEIIEKAHQQAEEIFKEELKARINNFLNKNIFEKKRESTSSFQTTKQKLEEQIQIIEENLYSLFYPVVDMFSKGLPKDASEEEKEAHETQKYEELHRPIEFFQRGEQTLEQFDIWLTDLRKTYYPPKPPKVSSIPTSSNISSSSPSPLSEGSSTSGTGISRGRRGRPFPTSVPKNSREESGKPFSTSRPKISRGRGRGRKPPIPASKEEISTTKERETGIAERILAEKRSKTSKSNSRKKGLTFLSAAEKPLLGASSKDSAAQQSYEDLRHSRDSGERIPGEVNFNKESTTPFDSDTPWNNRFEDEGEHSSHENNNGL